MKDKISVSTTDAKNHQARSEKLHQLRYWLANEDYHTSAYVRHFLEATPPDDAADALAQISKSAQPDTPTLASMLFLAFVMLFTTSNSLSNARKAGTRAALLLAQLKDARCLAPLVRVFETRRFYEGRYQEEIENALLRFFAAEFDRAEISQNIHEIHNLAERLWRSGKGRAFLSPRQSALLLALLPLLWKYGGGPELALLKSISASRTSSPNQARIVERAETLLHS